MNEELIKQYVKEYEEEIFLGGPCGVIESAALRSMYRHVSQEEWEEYTEELAEKDPRMWAHFLANNSKFLEEKKSK